MAGRRGKAKSLEEQVQAVEQKIRACKERLSELEGSRAELLKHAV